MTLDSWPGCSYMFNKWYGKRNGRRGVEFKITEEEDRLLVKINGTDHFFDILHHLRLPLTTIARGDIDEEIKVIESDLDLAWMIVEEIVAVGIDKPIVVYGHSWGGGLAAIVVLLLRITGRRAIGYIYAAKRVGNRAFVDALRPYIHAKRHRGDPVSFLPPWLAKFQEKVFGKWIPIVSHLPKNYWDEMIKDGVRD